MSELSKYIENFLWALQAEKRISDNSYKSYKYDLRVFLRYLSSKSLLITSEKVVEGFYFFLKLNKSSDSSINRKVNLVLKFLKFLNKEHNYSIATDYKINIKGSKVYRTCLESDDLDKIRSFLLKENKDNVRLSYIVEFLYSSALRVSELISLKKSSIEKIQKNKSLVIKGKGGVERLVFFSDRAIKSLDLYLKYYKVEEWILPLSRQRVFQLLKNLAKSVNIELTKVFPHSFRHRVLSNLVKNGMDLVSVQKIAGHKQISTTEKYTHVEDYLYEEVRRFHPVFKIVNK